MTFTRTIASALALLVATGVALPPGAGLAAPAETPPPGFAGNRFVDSAGCAFQRATVAGKVTWAPVMGLDRQPLCARPLVQAEVPPVVAAPAAPVAVVVAGSQAAPEPVVMMPEAGPAAAPVPAPAPVAVVAPVAVTAAPARVRRAKPVAAHATAVPPADATSPARRDALGRVVCPRGQPVLREVTLRDGNTQLRCAALPSAYQQGVRGSQPMIVPPGYKPAWSDGRLNPLRGRGTEAGARAMGRVWTDDVPMRGKPQPSAPPPLLYVVEPRARVSVKGQARAPISEPVAAAGGAVRGRFVQVGTFAVGSNADRAADRIAAAGLPVARAEGRLNGRPVQVVLAGPLAPGQAGAALGALRARGYRDAFVR
ncbi:SPOR domain-containing protein [Frigidibacter sp. MR17.24]|uniref:SPOR domain-containing protein n=1 Tax=Frigidibacter sp. MR17.24 TaxID=3127345 RepID=UPI003012CF66